MLGNMFWTWMILRLIINTKPGWIWYRGENEGKVDGNQQIYHYQCKRRTEKVKVDNHEQEETRLGTVSL